MFLLHLALVLAPVVVARGKATRVPAAPLVATGTLRTVMWPGGPLSNKCDSWLLVYNTTSKALQLSLTTRTLHGNMLLSLLVSCACCSSLPCHALLASLISPSSHLLPPSFPSSCYQLFPSLSPSSAGQVVGRCVVDTRVCASPGRDRDHDEIRLAPVMSSTCGPSSGNGSDGYPAQTAFEYVTNYKHRMVLICDAVMTLFTLSLLMMAIGNNFTVALSRNG